MLTTRLTTKIALEIVKLSVYHFLELFFFEKVSYYDLDDVVLMQSTGVRDKNGKEIFEGDVVKMAKNVYSEPTYYEVVRHRGGAYRLESKQYGCELWLRHTDCEIAGNIWENPELLEVKQ